jgi:hypothetical protein
VLAFLVHQVLLADRTFERPHYGLVGFDADSAVGVRAGEMDEVAGWFVIEAYATYSCCLVVFWGGHDGGVNVGARAVRRPHIDGIG